MEQQQQQQQAAAVAAVAASAQQQPSTQQLNPAPEPAAAAAPEAAQQTAEGGVPAAVPSPGQQPAAVVRRAEDSKVLKLKGLPYSTSDKDIIDFFGEYNVIEVAFVYEPDGRPSGLAFAEFGTREDALKALSKNGKYLGDRYVRLLHVPKQEMEEQVRLGTLAIPGAQAKMRQKMLRNSGYMDGPYGGGDGGLHGGGLLGGAGGPAGHGGQHGGQHGGGMGGGHDHLGGGGQHGGYGHLHGGGGGLMSGGMGGQPGMGQHGGGLGGLGMGGPPGGMGGHHGMLGHNSMGVHEQQQQQLQMGNQQGRGLPGSMGGMPPHMALAYQLSGMGISGPPRPTNNAMGVMQMMPPHGYGPGAGAAAPPMAVIGTDSKTIKIRGLPFRATPLDIFNFFDSYEIIAESLQLGVDALGRPSGEAWLTFSTADEALRAVRERNRHYLGNRYLELSLT